VPALPRSERLLRLYPRAWRERYGEEFLATVEHGSLHFQQTLDILSGAIDAWLSADVRRAIRVGSLATSEGGRTMFKSMLACGQTKSNYTKRDSLIGAGVLILVALVFSLLGIATGRQGWPLAAEILLGLAFPGAVALSMPFTFLKGKPWMAQVVMVGGLLAILTAISLLASLIGRG
jgi:hypothetical protein